MARTGEQAIDVARTESRDGTTFGVGMCLQRVRLAYGIPALYTDAATAWLRAAGRHPQTDPGQFPRGVPIFWTGGSAGHGHIAISTGDGECWSTDIVRPGRWDKVPIERIAREWGLRLVGWTDDLNGVLIPQEDDMPLTDQDIEKVADAVWSRVLKSADGNGAGRVMGFLYARQLGLAAAIDELAKGLDPAVQAAVKKAIAEGVVDVDVTVHDQTGD